MYSGRDWDHFVRNGGTMGLCRTVTIIGGTVKVLGSRGHFGFYREHFNYNEATLAVMGSSLAVMWPLWLLLKVHWAIMAVGGRGGSTFTIMRGLL